MTKAVQRRLWEMFAFASGAAAAAACRRGMTVLRRVSRHQDPPENPASRGVRWRDALIWSISLGVGAAVSRLGPSAALPPHGKQRPAPNRPAWTTGRSDVTVLGLDELPYRRRSLAVVEEADLPTPSCPGRIHHPTPLIAHNDASRSRQIAPRTGDMHERTKRPGR
jgi:hypothetical protein